jgi:S-methylmethionine-dependent homocysteine/selenocysteine methylase
MARYRAGLPQVDGGVFLTDSGIETVLIFHHGYELPDFAAFVLLDDEAGIETLRSYFRDHAAIARETGTGFIFESPTWRASPDWAERLGYGGKALAAANSKAIDMLVEIRSELDGHGDNQRPPMVVSGCVGPRGDGYQPAALMTADEAQGYHSTQIATFAETEADMVTAITMTYPDEAIGIVRSAQGAGMPAAISFTVETDGALPDGSSLEQAIGVVDDATGGGPAYYMVNCAHPTHFDHVLESGGDWRGRVRGIRANASRMSHAELDEADELDDGDPHELGRQYEQLLSSVPDITVLGGCCGTDLRHVQQIAATCVRPRG